MLNSLTSTAQKALSEWFRRTAGGDRRPVMFDIDETYPALRHLDRAYPDIKAELDTILADRTQLPAYHDLDPDQATISASTPSEWKIFYLWAMGDKAEPNVSRCPHTTAALSRIPHVFQAFFSILEPGKSVPAHRGPYCGYLRYHLGLRVPAESPPRIRVRDELYTWQEGKSVLFDDSWDHEVFNESTEQRVVLIVDVLRPMPPVQHLLNRGAALVARQTYGRQVLRRAAGATAGAAKV